MSAAYRDLGATSENFVLQLIGNRRSVIYNLTGVVVRLSFLVVLFLGGCAVGQPVDKDFLGNVYPPECKDVSDVHIAVRETTVEAMRQLTGFTTRRHLYSVWLQFVFKPHEIWIDKDLPDHLRADVIRHEKCHEKMWLLTGDGNWHKK